MDTRLRILETTAELLQQSTGEPPSTRAVCQAAGITPPTLYHHFGDKDGLYDAVVAYGFDAYLTAEHSRDASGDPVADVRRAWDAHVGFAVAHPALYSLMYGTARGRVSTPPAVAEARAVITSLLTRVAEVGRLTLDLERATPAVEAAVVGAALQALRSGHDRAVSDQLRDIVLASIIEPDSSGTSKPPLPGVDPLISTARQLSALLHDGGAGRLTPEETALLRQWLKRLADVPGQRTQPAQDQRP